MGLQAEFRDAQGPKRIVDLIREAPDSDVAHRILLIFQVLADKEADRKSLVQSGVCEALKPFLNPQRCTEARAGPDLCRTPHLGIYMSANTLPVPRIAVAL